LLAASRWSGVTKEIRAHGAYTNIVENTFSVHEHAIVDLIIQHKVERAFLTGHSLGGGIANVAHLVVRGQLALAQTDDLGKNSAWAKLYAAKNGAWLGDKITWLSCTFASPQTIVRKYLYDHENKPPCLVADLDASSYNIVYGCDAVPRVLGMLKYLGGILEIVVPEIPNDELEKKVEDRPFFERLFLFPGLKVVDLFLKKKLDGAGVTAVEFLKKNGMSEVAGQFTHTGNIVYLAPEATLYVNLLGKDDIHKVLDVGGEDFKTLLGEQKDYLKSLAYAHGHSYKPFVFRDVAK
jgi:hypothetical protein